MKKRSWMALWMALVLLVCINAAAQDKGAKESGTSVSLQQAYKREFAFLQSEKASLRKRLDAQKEASTKAVAAAETELSALQTQILAASVEADRLAGFLEDAASKADTAEEADDVVTTLLTQASVTLEKGDIKLPEAQGEQARAQQLRTAFEQSIHLLQRYASVRKDKGAFFSASGKQVEGQLLTIGNVATYGVSQNAAGALAPAGKDRLKVWTETPSASYARALTEGKQPNTIGIFLYESLDKSIDAKEKQSAFEHVGSGGIIAWVIVSLGIAGLLLVLARALVLARSGLSIDSLVARLTPLVARDDLAGAKKLCVGSKASAKRVLTVTLDNLHGPRERLEDAVSEAILHEHAKLDRFGALILVIAAVAPLLGLLGTVTGMISTFDVITEFGTGDPKMLSGGISEALVTTELGLVVAIPHAAGRQCAQQLGQRHQRRPGQGCSARQQRRRRRSVSRTFRRIPRRRRSWHQPRHDALRRAGARVHPGRGHGHAPARLRHPRALVLLGLSGRDLAARVDSGPAFPRPPCPSGQTFPPSGHPRSRRPRWRTCLHLPSRAPRPRRPAARPGRRLRAK